jgi:glyoxylase-like metal-dependent hydrolase (beta-lactamase superfamily II)
LYDNLFLKKIGFDPCGHTTGFVLWCNGAGIMVDPPPFSNSYLKSMGINPAKISAIIITHCHADHDAGAIEKILFEKKIEVTYFSLYSHIHQKQLTLPKNGILHRMNL